MAVIQVEDSRAAFSLAIELSPLSTFHFYDQPVQLLTPSAVHDCRNLSEAGLLDALCFFVHKAELFLKVEVHQIVSSESYTTVDLGLLTWALDEQFTRELLNILVGKTYIAEYSMHTATSSRWSFLGLEFSGVLVEVLRRDVP